MTSARIYALPVDMTGWHFDGKTEVLFNWEYDDGSAALLDLYDKGKKQQWDANVRIDWKQLSLCKRNRSSRDDRRLPADVGRRSDLYLRKVCASWRNQSAVRSHHSNCWFDHEFRLDRGGLLGIPRLCIDACTECCYSYWRHGTDRL